ncbi:MetQ/NlpA family ABC transporter substrate-binding protein [Clostridiaceae bacterium M8S5]|nr:MetQ/NlpA family ABC transporter substrate-binding protein [Clostridiaceae bacterium M8S5]
MKKQLYILLSIFALVIFVSTGCNRSSKENTIKIGATPVPHGEILALIKDDLKKENINLEIIEFNDYIKPNIALSDKEIDANFFQHTPYLNDFKSERKLDLEVLCSVHIEPLGVYSQSIKSIKDIKDGSSIALPNGAVNQGRAFLLLEKNGLIKLKENSGLKATEKDIVKNPHNLKFKFLEAAQIPRILPDVDLAVINGNFALASDLNPVKDAIILEDKDSPYVNIVAIRKNKKNKKVYQKLIQYLQSEKVKNFIKEKYNGGVVDAFK